MTEDKDNAHDVETFQVAQDLMMLSGEQPNSEAKPGSVQNEHSLVVKVEIDQVSAEPVNGSFLRANSIPSLTITSGQLDSPDVKSDILRFAEKSQLSPDPRRRCCVEGCKSQARAFHRCKKHGGSKRCSHPECTKRVQSRGLCIRHGGGPRCQEEGCTRAAQSHGRCKMHGGGRPCMIAGCEKKAHLKRLCRHHGGGARCIVAACTKWAQRDHMCMTHFRSVSTEQY